MTPLVATPIYTLVEGQGEVKAVPALLARLGQYIGVHLAWSAPRRWKNIHLWEPGPGGRGGLLQGLEFMRSKRQVGGVLVLRGLRGVDSIARSSATTVATGLRAT